jgi:hypothetical protein
MKIYSEDQVRAKLAREVAIAGGQRAFSRESGISATHVGRVLAGEKLSPAILTSLGLEVAGTVMTYRRIRK